MNSGTQEYELSSRIIIKETVSYESRVGARETGVGIVFDDDPQNFAYAANRIGFGAAGFETFELDIPDEFRGKVSTLRFELEQSSSDVYLDNVFFQSQYVSLGNPTNARIQFNPNLSETANDTSNNGNRNNYLIEKPQYTISYNDSTKTPNWVSWQLNKSWIGGEPRTDLFEADRTLPVLWETVQGDGDINGNPDAPYGEFYNRGHMVASGDRTRNEKDNYATFLMSNMVPQNEDNNSDIPLNRWWLGLENFSRLLVDDGKELYIIAGSYGEKSTLYSSNGFDINVPERLWKVIVVMDKPGQTIADVSQNTIAFAIDIPNKNPATDTFEDSDGNLTIPTDWRDYVIPIRVLEANLAQQEMISGLQYDFLSNLREEIQNTIENRDRDIILNWINSNISTAPLLAESFNTESTLERIGTDTAIGHNGFIEDTIFAVEKQFSGSPKINIGEIAFTEIGFTNSSISKDGFSKIDLNKATLSEDSISKIYPWHITSAETTLLHAGADKFSKAQVTLIEPTSNKIGVTEVGFLVNTTSNDVINPKGISKVSSSAVLFSPSIISNQFFSIHNSTSPFSTETLNSNFNTSTSTNFNLNIKFQIADLPTGQLAESTITGYDQNGRPNSGTLTLDINGNGVGWFIDTTPFDNSEFTTQLADTAYSATPDSPAYGKYDLLTTILHELGHLNGIIRGNSAFDSYVRNINGIPTFSDGNITAQLTPDGSHLNSTLYPYDLMNTSLKPGVRKLPSALNLAMINAINTGVESWKSRVSGTITAPLTAGALIALTNGDFTTTDSWNLEGATNILNGTATLTEQSQKLSSLTQAFTIPTGAKTLQFTIVDNHLIPGDTAKAANDAFEVALLDTNTFTPLAGTIASGRSSTNDLTHTDSLLNIQANGTIHKSDKVTITPLGNNSKIVSIDLTQIAPDTNATLYFNLIGFGAKTSTITIDNVILLTDTQPNPTPLISITKPAKINEGQVARFAATATDSTIFDTLTYSWNFGDNTNPITTRNARHTFANNGTYNVTLTMTDKNGGVTTQTVEVIVDNVTPTIVSILPPDNITEGKAVEFNSIVTDAGVNDTLTYTWNFGDNTAPVSGVNPTHTFIDNGNYNVTLTVTDADGGVTTQTIVVKVDNLPPTVVSIVKPDKLTEGRVARFAATATDPGILDTLTYSWNFGDNTNPINTQNARHTFADNGTYNVTLTVTDKDGGVTTQTVEVIVDNVPPVIVSILTPDRIDRGQAVEFNSIVTDAGVNDNVTYRWDFGDNTAPVSGVNPIHTFTDRGTYSVTLSAIDKDGGITTRTVEVTVD